MNRRWTMPLALVVIAGLLAAGLPVRGRLLDERRQIGLKELELDKLPPLGAASLLLLGGFRGVAVDVLWLRVVALHQKRQYEEERSLIELITRLQPYYISVWVFQAWNIAYNISVQYPDAADQWKWVKNGIAFLKKGIELNPGKGDLYFYLAVMHRDKVNQNPYFEEAMERELGVNNFEEAARYFDRARTLGGVQTFHPRVVDSGVFHSHLARIEQILRRSELTADLDFPPGTLKKARPFIGKCRVEAKHLDETWRHTRNGKVVRDAAFVMFPARVDLVFFDGYLAQIDKVVAEGGHGEESVGRARKILDKALADLAKYRPKYRNTESEQVIRNKTSDGYSRIPWALVKHVRELMGRPFAGVPERRRAAQLLRLAENELNNVPEPHRKCRDVQLLLNTVPAWRKSIETLLRKGRRKEPPRSGTDGN